MSMPPAPKPQAVTSHSDTTSLGWDLEDARPAKADEVRENVPSAPPPKAKAAGDNVTLWEDF
jgi:hypothetical protein